MAKKALRLFIYFLLICLVVALLNFKTTLSYILNYESYRELNQGNGLKEVRNSLFLYAFDEDLEYDEEASFGTSLEAPLTEEDKDRIQEILSRIRHSWLIPPQKVPTAKNDRYDLYGISRIFIFIRRITKWDISAPPVSAIGRFSRT